MGLPNPILHLPGSRYTRARNMDLTNVSNQRRGTIVGLLFTASLIKYLDRAAISFALPLISNDLHLTPATKGLLLSSFFWSYALRQVPISYFPSQK